MNRIVNRGIDKKAPKRFLVKFLFAGVKLVIPALHFKQLIVSAALDYLALLKHHYRVCVADG